MASSRALTLPIIYLFLSGSDGNITAVLGRFKAQPWSPIDTLVGFGLRRCARRVKGGFFLHGWRPIGATHAEVHMGRCLTGGDNWVHSSIHKGSKTDDDLFNKGRRRGTWCSGSADGRAKAMDEGGMSK